MKVLMKVNETHRLCEVYSGAQGLLADGGAELGSLLIDCSTCEPAIGKQVARLASERGHGIRFEV